MTPSPRGQPELPVLPILDAGKTDKRRAAWRVERRPTGNGGAARACSPAPRFPFQKLLQRTDALLSRQWRARRDPQEHKVGCGLQQAGPKPSGHPLPPQHPDQSLACGRRPTNTCSVSELHDGLRAFQRCGETHAALGKALPLPWQPARASEMRTEMRSSPGELPELGFYAPVSHAHPGQGGANLPGATCKRNTGRAEHERQAGITGILGREQNHLKRSRISPRGKTQATASRQACAYVCMCAHAHTRVNAYGDTFVYDQQNKRHLESIQCPVVFSALIFSKCRL